MHRSGTSVSKNLVLTSYDATAVGPVGRRSLVMKTTLAEAGGALADGQHGTESSDG